MSTSLYNFAEVEAKKASPLAINDHIRAVLRGNESACYSELEPYLIPPGVSGSRQFDQAYAVSVLLKHDAKHNDSLINIALRETSLSHRALWDRLQSVLRRAGFQMKHGRLIGVLEDKSGKNGDENDDQGQPDID